MIRILIVDDDPSIRQIIATLLTLEGFVADAVPDGRAALQHMLTTVPAMVLSDVRMPHMDGYALLASMRAHPSLDKIPFVLLSGISDSEAAAAQSVWKADAVLSKPFTRDALLDTVHQFTRKINP